MEQILNISDPLIRVQSLWTLLEGFHKAQNTWDASLFTTIKLLSVHKTRDSKFTTSFQFTAQKSHCNPMASMHGGCIATIFDFLTTISCAPAAAPGFWDGISVSQALNCTYMKPIKEGDVVRVDCEIVHMGRASGVVRGVMRNEKGVVLCTCEHLKTSSGAFKL